MKTEYYIGLMSGTSLDGVDAGLFDFSQNRFQLISFYYQPFSSEVKKKIIALCKHKQTISLADYGELDTQLGQLYADVIINLLHQTQLSPQDIKAIGNHGQTLYHAPNSKYPFTLQIGDANIISQITGITTVADFRRRDIAAGGQGAPLVPAFHQAVFQSSTKNRVVVNIGGIANITILPSDCQLKTTGFDTGPGNTLMDGWISQYDNSPFDKNGAWAATGTIQTELLNRLKDEPFFSAPAPKSTGTEYFCAAWLKQKLSIFTDYLPEDIQRTLCQFTAETIAESIQNFAPDTQQVFICGGGIHNLTLINALNDLLKLPIESTKALHIDPDQVEAMAFAWLAKRTLEGLAGNLPATTGAKDAVILGGIYQA